MRSPIIEELLEQLRQRYFELYQGECDDQHALALYRIAAAAGWATDAESERTVAKAVERAVRALGILYFGEEA